MAQRLDVAKTHKLYIGGAFPRSESGRSLPIEDANGKVIAHACRASRKDLRDAVVAARSAAPAWAARTAYNRGQILHRLAEMLEGRADEFAKTIKQLTGENLRLCRAETTASVDRLIAFAGWTDKFQSILGSHNPVAGPYYTFTIPDSIGVCAVVAPDDPPLLGLVSLLAPILAAGGVVVALGSEACPLPTAMLGELCATSDVPPGVVNLLTGERAELIPHIASHREINAIHAANLEEDQARALRLGAAENVKRVLVRDLEDDSWTDPETCEHPWWIEPFVEMKTIWHPSAT